MAVAPDGGATPPDAGGVADAGASTSIVNHMFDGQVLAILHVGTSFYVGGSFHVADAFPAPDFIVLSPSGAPQSSCLGAVSFDGPVLAFAQAGNAVYVGGAFEHVDGQAFYDLVKLDATTCLPDETFRPPDGNVFDATVSALAVSGTSLYVGGAFTSYRGVANSANRLAKLDLASGALDATFSPVGVTSNGFNGQVDALAASGTSLYVGGGFTSYRGVANSANHLAKLDLTSGALDTTFGPGGATSNGFNGEVNALAVSGASLYAGGGFTSYRGVANSANALAKLDLASGTLDTTFSPAGATSNGFTNPTGTSGTVDALAASGTSLYVGGDFTRYRGVANSSCRLAKLDLTSGALDTTFSPVGAVNNGFDNDVRALAVSGTSLYVGGSFNLAFRGGVVSSTNAFAKLDATTGALDASFVAPGSTVNGFMGTNVEAIAVVGGSLWVGGGFETYGGLVANGVAKLDDTTLALDTTFSPSEDNGFDDFVDALAADGASLYVGGGFTSYRGAVNSAHHLAKLDLTSGALDTTFGPAGATSNGFDDDVYAVTASGMSLYVGGTFTSYRGVANSANRLAKLDLTSGALDTTFSPAGATSNGFDSGVYALAASGTSLYAGGDFTSYRGAANSANRLAKLDLTSGALDTTFSPTGATSNGFDSGVYALAASSTALYVGGDFTRYRGIANSANALAKLDLTSGAIDTTFSPVGSNGFDNTVLALLYSGGALYAGGRVDAYHGVADSARSLAKLDATSGVLDTTFGPAGASGNGFDGFVEALAVSGKGLAVGGDFSLYRGVTPANDFALLDAATGASR